ncbi:MAG: hypothetical protein LBC89_05950 [Bacteroidales bacterium]|nr:hypothetical protein [Bacteroidales bacterium]
MVLPFRRDVACNVSANGLGLSIVKSIADLYGMEISYRFENRMHVFEISRNKKLVVS